MTNYDNANTQRNSPVKTVDPSIQGQINPDKTMKADGRTDAASQDQNSALKFKFESNFDNFVTQMLGRATITDGFSQMFLQGFATIAQSGLSENFALQVAEFFAAIDIDEGDMLNFFKQQTNSSLKFNGAFFSLLNHVMENSQSAGLKTGILDFLKKYVDMSERNHLSNNINTILKQMEGQIFKNPREQFLQLTAQLGANPSANIDIIKDSIMPFLNKYISSYNDRGQLREMTSLLATYTARLENGNDSRVIAAFENIMRYQAMQDVFKDFKPELLIQVLQNTEYEKSIKGKNWSDKLKDIIAAGMEGEAGSDNKIVFKNLMQSILLNESVYMPVIHTMLPMMVGGKMTFGELWIDPNAGNSSQKQKGERIIQGLLKFDIEEVGFFDMYFIYSGENINLQITCPEEMAEYGSQIKDDIAAIFSRNNIRVQEMFVDSGQSSIPISQAFPKIFERKNSINVSI